MHPKFLILGVDRKDLSCEQCTNSFDHKHIFTDVLLLLQGVAALCLEMSLQVQCGILSKYFQFLNNTHDLPTWDILTQNANQPFIVRQTDLTQNGHSFFLPTARTSVVSSAQIPSITQLQMFHYFYKELQPFALRCLYKCSAAFSYRPQGPQL